MRTNSYFFPDTVVGLALAFNKTLSLRAAGYSTHLTVAVLAGFTMHKLTATPATRLSRKERGLV